MRWAAKLIAGVMLCEMPVMWCQSHSDSSEVIIPNLAKPAALDFSEAECVRSDAQTAKLTAPMSWSAIPSLAPDNW
jgi:hypothetical protein